MWHGVVIFFLYLQEEPGKSDFAGGLLFNLSKCFTRCDFCYTDLKLLNIYPVTGSKKWKWFNFMWVDGLNNGYLPNLNS